MLRGIGRFFFLYIVLLFVAVQQGVTHPHMFFTMRPHIIFNATGVTEIVVQWELDEFNSEMFINDCDANGNFEIDEEEMALVREHYTDTYAEENYYLTVYEGRSREPIENVAVSLKRAYIRNRQIRMNVSIDYPIPFSWKTQVIILRFTEPRNLFSFVYNKALEPRYTKNTGQETPPVQAKYNAKYPNHIFVQVGKTGKLGEGIATVGEEDIESLFEGIGDAPGRGSSLKAQFYALQAQYNKKVSDLVMRAKTSLSVGMVLLILGFAYLYGMLHSAGPGHGKTFVVGFFLQHHAPWFQAIVFAFMIATIHIGSAILLSAAFLTLLSNYSGMERLMLQVNLSFGIAVFIFCLGVYLLIQQIRHHHSHAE
ncbi:DUF1007 family protein, partial [bacterium]|nr:DUF1007 family protein [bacterium]